MKDKTAIEKFYIDELLCKSSATDLQKYLQRLGTIEQNLKCLLEQKDAEIQNISQYYQTVTGKSVLQCLKNVSFRKYLYISFIVSVIGILVYVLLEAISPFLSPHLHTLKDAIFSEEIQLALDGFSWIIPAIVIFVCTNIILMLTSRDRGGYKTFLRIVLLFILAVAFSYYCIGDMATSVAKYIEFENWVLFKILSWWVYLTLAMPYGFLIYFLMNMFACTQKILVEIKGKINEKKFFVSILVILISSMFFLLCSVLVIDCTLMFLSMFLSNSISMSILIHSVFFVFIFLYMRTQYYRMRALYKMSNKFIEL